MKIFLVLILLFISTTTFAAEQKEWTLLVFLNGHNNLDSYGTLNVNQMKAADNKDVNIVVQWASLRHGKTRRVLVEKNSVKVIEEMAPVDMGDYKQLVEFIRWAKVHYPAKHYFVDVWNHGNGWKMRPENVQISNISYDDLTGNSITTPQLGIAMKEAKKILGQNVDIYGSDACLMQMVEVTHELKGSVDFVVGSQEVEPGEGWDYAKVLNRWGDSPKEVAKGMVTSYFENGYNDATFSAVDMKQGQKVVDSLKKFQAQILQAKGVKAAINKSMSYTYSDYVDIGDFLKNLKAGDSRVDTSEVEAALKKFVIANQSNGDKANSSGLSVWLPIKAPSGEMKRYKELKFDRETGWGEMLDKISK